MKKLVTSRRIEQKSKSMKETRHDKFFKIFQDRSTYLTGKRSAGNDRGAVDMPMGGGGGRQGCVVYEARVSEQGERASIVHPLGAMPCASADCIQVDICHRNITANFIISQII